MDTVFVDPRRCIGCKQCEYACAVEHSVGKDPLLAALERPAPVKRIHVEAGAVMGSSFASKCRHCDPAPCEQVCPTAAIFRDASTRLVLVDPGKCISCAMCAMVCPFDVVTFHEAPGVDHGRIVATKCDGCVDRVHRGEEPACVEACKVDALTFGDLNELVAAGRARAGVAVLTSAATAENGGPALPATVAGWRAFGASITAVRGGVRDDHEATR